MEINIKNYQELIKSSLPLIINNFNDIISYHRFFYIDKDFTITIKDFIQDELYTQSFKNKTFKINQEGFFIREKNN